MRTEAINRSLEHTISRSRLFKYLDATNGNLDAALGLYERNTRLSEALYTTLQGLEICLRNTIDCQMRNTYGVEWLTNQVPPLSNNALQSIQDAYDNLNNANRDSVVAELKFSFWVGLLAKTYDSSLWRNALYRGFISTGGKKRSFVHGRMNALRRFRNRVAHHEPIFDKADQMHAEALEAIEWMCRDTHAWVTDCSRFVEVFNERI